MSNKSVEELFVQFFQGEDICNTTTTHTEEWLSNNQNTLQDFIDIPSDNHITSNTKQVSNSTESFSDSQFVQLFRMKRTTYEDLSSELVNNVNLLICLCVLGNTRSFSEIASLLRMEQQELFNICEEYCDKIVKLSSKYVFWPGDTEVLANEKGFLSDYKFPGVVGVIGSLHISVYLSQTDPHASNYYNKATENHTIVLQAVCDNNLLFRDIFVGYPGSHSISTILRASAIYRKLTDENDSLTKTKRHLLGGTEHPQMNTLLTPFSIPEDRKPTERELKFNELHSSVMYTVEKTFRMVQNRFPRMKNLDTASPKFATLAAGAICILHNFCRLRNDNSCS